jgi:hypothetical protein
MSPRLTKPVVHGRDHAPGGSDPIPGGLGHTIQDEAVNLTQRAKLNFVGAGVTATDDSANNRTTVTIPGGGAAAVYHPRFVVATVNGLTVPSGVGAWQVPFPLTEIITNDVNGLSGFGTPQGYWIPSGSTSWVGDHFANAAGTGNPFQIRADTATGHTAGLYLITVGMTCGPNNTQTITVSVALPRSGGANGSGAPPFGITYAEPVTFAWPLPQQWTRTLWVHITDAAVVFPPDDIGVSLTYNGAEAITADLAISCTRLNLA